MINLLPPQIKEQITYSKRNAIIVHYLWLAAFTMIVLGGVFGGSYWYLQGRIASAEQAVAQKETSIAGFKGLESKVKTLNSRLSTIKAIQSQQAKFSQVLTDVAKAMPAGASLNNINLSGDASKPVTIDATADSYATAVALRDTLAASPRIAAADLQTVNATGSNYHVSIVLSFKPGQAK
jgi:Tfp pilus assembly protein PilN